MRTKMIAGNWKMNSDRSQTRAFMASLEDWLTNGAAGKKSSEAVASGKMEIVIAPPFTSIDAAISARRSGVVQIAAQNVYHKPGGAFTGEVSLPMLEEAGCKYAIIGHSERRHVFGESHDELEKKLVATLNSRVLPIFCVGELLEEREAGRMKQVLAGQLESAWKSLDGGVVGGSVVVAYEPVWAIGTGQTASDADAEDACRYIRSLASDKFGESAGEALRILYGGSVKPDNSKSLLSQKNIDGLLIGGASLDAASFQSIIETAL